MFIDKFKEIANAIISSDKADNQTKMTKLKEFHRANKSMFEKLSPTDNVQMSYFIGDHITKLKRGE